MLLDSHESVEVKGVKVCKDNSEETEATFKVDPFTKFGQSLTVNVSGPFLHLFICAAKSCFYRVTYEST